MKLFANTEEMYTIIYLLLAMSGAIMIAFSWYEFITCTRCVTKKVGIVLIALHTAHIIPFIIFMISLLKYEFQGANSYATYILEAITLSVLPAFCLGLLIKGFYKYLDIWVTFYVKGERLVDMERKYPGEFYAVQYLQPVNVQWRGILRYHGTEEAVTRYIEENYRRYKGMSLGYDGLFNCEEQSEE